ncbi:hypothetical protein EYF80_006308 [Liparis tanakae]|uniref:Uncharacterized protein n=1 Tax=Liparis tanakae TaxID=230148 RepID=A0A4Z2IZZ4_9TELE|nr:hypothetical protein EYF80_006308 [Liparis tanakae]
MESNPQQSCSLAFLSPLTIPFVLRSRRAVNSLQFMGLKALCSEAQAPPPNYCPLCSAECKRGASRLPCVMQLNGRRIHRMCSISLMSPGSEEAE